MLQNLQNGEFGIEEIEYAQRMINLGRMYRDDFQQIKK
jgi:hypothetical protein